MAVTLHWFLPSGESRTVVPFGPDGHDRPVTIDYHTLLAKTADMLGFTGVLTPTGTHCEDAWLLAAALSAQTKQLKFLVAFRPGLISPTLAAQQAATLQRISGGRLLLNVVTGGSDDEQRRFGDWLDHDARYERTGEFLTVLRNSWTNGPFEFEGKYYHVSGATVSTPPKPTPDIYFGGASPAAERIAADHADVYLAWGEPPATVRPRLEHMRELAERAGRRLRFGIRLHTIARDTSADAWAVTRRFLEHLDPAAVERSQRSLARTQSVGQERMLSLHRGSTADLEIAPNLWAGYGLVRGGAGTTLVGSHEEVADRIEEYHDLGFEEFILSGYPHIEEAYWFAEGVMPVLRQRGLLLDGRPVRARTESGFAFAAR